MVSGSCVSLKSNTDEQLDDDWMSVFFLYFDLLISVDDLVNLVLILENENSAAAQQHV